MASITNVLSAFNRGVISPLALARVDLKRTALSAETQTNWIPRVLGAMMLRPGLGYTGGTRSNAKAFHIPFVFANDDLAVIELTNLAMRVKISDAAISRPSVSTTIANPDFNAGTDWTDDDEAGAASVISGGDLQLTGTGINSAKRYQAVTVAAGDQNKEHALSIGVNFGTLEVGVGTSNGASDVLAFTTIGQGKHSLAFTPTTGTVYVQFRNRSTTKARVEYCSLDAAGDLVLTTPWPEAVLPLVRYDQSADVVYVAVDGYAPYKIERRATRSWSLVPYLPADGPFRVENTTDISLTPSALSGEINLTASRAFFTASHIGALFAVSSVGQTTGNNFTGNNEEGDYIRVTGVGNSRGFDIVITGTWTGYIRLQRSVTEPGDWVDVSGQVYTSNYNNNYVDGLDNQIVYYRLVTPASGIASGTAVTSLSYASGSLKGIVRVYALTSSTVAICGVLKTLGGTKASRIWQEGAWSASRGWPSAVALYEGRLAWAGKNKLWLSVSDAYESFDGDVEGDSGPIDRTIGSGPLDSICWLSPLLRLVVGTEGAEWSVRSSSFDEILTPSNINLKAPSTEGSRQVAATKVDNRAVFVQKSGTRVMQMVPSDNAVMDYQSVELTEFCPEIGEPGIVRLAVQRKPDTRIHCVRSDGKVAVLVSQPAEDVICWVLYETDGTVEDAFVLPGDVEDEVYYCVKRTIGTSTVRYLEKFALESECQGGTLNKQSDSFAVYDGASATSISGFTHLAGETVTVWADGKDVGTHTVSAGGVITLATAAAKVVAGLSYRADYLSAKLVGIQYGGMDLPDKKRISEVSVVLYNTHYQGLKYGKSLATADLQALPLVEKGKVIPADTIHSQLSTTPFTFPGEFTSDARLALQAASPRPCTVLAAILGMTSDDIPA